MSYHFQPYAQEQMYLMPPTITEWVAEGSLARFVSEILEELDREGALTSFYDQYREDGWGSAAYHPLMMVKVVVYGYSVGITSSRRIAQALDGIGFRGHKTNFAVPFWPSVRLFSDVDRVGSMSQSTLQNARFLLAYLIGWLSKACVEFLRHRDQDTRASCLRVLAGFYP